jgi:hypothetical protein
MLVRFLSYAASIIGARRYKPLLISCLALIFTITGIAIVASAVSSSSPDASSQVSATDKPKTGQQQPSSPLGSLQQKSPKDSATIQPQTSQSTTPSDQKQSNGTSPTAADNANFDISLNTAMVSLNQANPNTAVTVSTNDGSIVQWSITPLTADPTIVTGLSARIDQSNTPGNAVIRLKADTITPGTYQFTVTGKDAGRGVSASKIITVTVS